MIDLHNGDIEEHLLPIEILSVIDLHNGDIEKHLLTIENIISDRSTQGIMNMIQEVFLNTKLALIALLAKFMMVHR